MHPSWECLEKLYSETEDDRDTPELFWNVNNEVNINSRAVFVYVYEMFVGYNSMMSERQISTRTVLSYHTFLTRYSCEPASASKFFMRLEGRYKISKTTFLNSNGFKEKSLWKVTGHCSNVPVFVLSNSLPFSAINTVKHTPWKLNECSGW